MNGHLLFLLLLMSILLFSRAFCTFTLNKFIRKYRLCSMKLNILHEDTDFIAVSKPFSVLSVPGRKFRITNETIPRDAQWEIAIRTLLSILETDESNSPLIPYLRKITLFEKRVPRNQIKLKQFLKQTIRMPDETLQEMLWVKLSETDRRLYSIDLKSLPPDLVSMADLVEEHCGHKIHPVHRLDQDTSGLLVFAKNAKSASSISNQFRDRQVSYSNNFRILLSGNNLLFLTNFFIQCLSLDIKSILSQSLWHTSTR